MSEEPLSDLKKLVDNATTEALTTDPLEQWKQACIAFLQKCIAFLRRSSLFPSVRGSLIKVCEFFIARLRPQLATSSTLTEAVKSIEVPTETVSEPLKSVDLLPEAVLESSQPLPVEQVSTPSKTESIREKEEKKDLREFSLQVETRQKYLMNQREERLKQAKLTFKIALVALIIGILLIFTGVVCIFFVKLPVAIVSTASGIISSIVSALAFRLNKEVNDRLDVVAKDLSFLEKTGEAMHYREPARKPRLLRAGMNG